MSTIPKRTLYDRVAFPYIFSCRKHGLAGPDGDPNAYAAEQINALSNVEFLQAISDALEDMSQVDNQAKVE